MTEEEIASMKAENESAKAEAAKLKADIEEIKKKAAPPKEDDDLQAKARKEREEAEKSSNNSKKLENALKFNIGLPDFAKNNKDLLGSELEGIVKAAEKENYDTAMAKSNAIKVGFIGSFFAVQANMDLLTPAQKIQLEDFQKLTKNGKEEKAEHIYENIFEPALEMMKKIKKAEEVGKSRGGFATTTTVSRIIKID